MIAWDVLTGGSSIQNGTAWEHLNSQISGEPSYIVLTDGLEVSMIEQDFVLYTDSDLEVDVTLETQEFDVEVDTDITLEVCRQ